MYIYIFEQLDPDDVDGFHQLPLRDPSHNTGDCKILLLQKPPLRNGSYMTLAHDASIIFSFHSVGLLKLMKTRYVATVGELAEKYLGIRAFEDGFFVSDKELLLFTLKYQGLSNEKLLDFPLI